MLWKSRNAYTGTRRRLVIAFDIGTTWSGISYSILDPGRVPKVEGVTSFPGSEPGKLLSVSKVPSVLYYNTKGDLKAVGGETISAEVKDQAVDEKWIKVEWFKLHLRSKPVTTTEGDSDPVPPLPEGKGIEDIFADYMQYLNTCALRFIEHAHGADMWQSLSANLNPQQNEYAKYPIGQGVIYVLSHPNGWEGYQQQVYSEAIVKAGLLPDDIESLGDRLRFVSEGEASLHWAMESLASKISKGTGFTVVDAGGGTIDVSSYRRKRRENEERGSFDEIASPSCYFQGSVFVTVRARLFLKQRLIDSEYFDDIDDILEAFDDTTKLRFRDPQDPQFVRFGGVGDNDQEVGIRFGQLRLKGEEVAALFKPSIECIRDAILEQRKLATTSISHVILVGGFVNNDYLFESVKASLDKISVKIHRLDNLPDKAVANGAISFFCNHFVRARITKVSYGYFAGVKYNKEDYAQHRFVRRPRQTYKDRHGDTYIKNYYHELLKKNAKIREGLEIRRRSRAYSADNFSKGTNLYLTIWTHEEGVWPSERFWGEEGNKPYTRLCTVIGDASMVPRSPYVQDGVEMEKLLVTFILHFGLPSFRAEISWLEGGIEKRRPARIIYDSTFQVSTNICQPPVFGYVPDP